MTETYETIKVRFESGICYLQFNRPEANNTINDTLILECSSVLKKHGKQIQVLVLQGLPEVFCFGADFKSISEAKAKGETRLGPDVLYDLWLQLATGPFVTVAHVRGKANAGGIGFVAACDIVLADETAVFSLSELLFGLYPACVLPFLIKRTGQQKAHYMTLMTKPVSVEQAHTWGLVDAYDANGDDLLRKHLLRLRRLSKDGIQGYKRYMLSQDEFLYNAKDRAVKGNLDIFSNEENLAKITRYVETGQFPWENR